MPKAPRNFALGFRPIQSDITQHMIVQFRQVLTPAVADEPQAEQVPGRCDESHASKAAAVQKCGFALADHCRTYCIDTKRIML